VAAACGEASAAGNAVGEATTATGIAVVAAVGVGEAALDWVASDFLLQATKQQPKTTTMICNKMVLGRGFVNVLRKISILFFLALTESSVVAPENRTGG
jgi:hypothetical protein